MLVLPIVSRHVNIYIYIYIIQKPCCHHNGTARYSRQGPDSFSATREPRAVPISANQAIEPIYVGQPSAGPPRAMDASDWEGAGGGAALLESQAGYGIVLCSSLLFVITTTTTIPTTLPLPLSYHSYHLWNIYIYIQLFYYNLVYIYIYR